MSALVDHIADQGEEAPGFAALWSDMPRDVMESVHLHAHDPATHARLTMQAPSARVEISIAPRAKGACAVAANDAPVQIVAPDLPDTRIPDVASQAKTQEKDQTP